MSVCAAPTCSHQSFDGSSYYVDVDVDVDQARRDYVRCKVTRVIVPLSHINW